MDWCAYLVAETDRFPRFLLCMQPVTLSPETPTATQAPANALKSKGTLWQARPGLRPPMSDSLNELTQLLRRAGDDAATEEQLLGLVYGELRGMAARFMHGQNKGHSLQPTDLVHECFLKIHRRDPDTYANRGHFLAVAARAMRSILVDHARAVARSAKRANTAFHSMSGC